MPVTRHPAPAAPTARVTYGTSAAPASFTCTLVTTSAWEIVTGSTVTITNPADARVVFAACDAYFANAGTAVTTARLRLGISMDGGTTWQYGGTPTANPSNTGAAQRIPVAATKVVVGTPTGNIQARIEGRQESGTAGWISISLPGISLIAMPG